MIIKKKQKNNTTDCIFISIFFDGANATRRVFRVNNKMSHNFRIPLNEIANPDDLDRKLQAWLIDYVEHN